MPRLENWYKTKNYDGSYALYGIIYGHKEIEDGKFVKTSEIVSMNDEKTVAETLNTVYDLGASMIKDDADMIIRE